jgi:hypothetical protein
VNTRAKIGKVPSDLTLIGWTFILLDRVSHTVVPGERVIPAAVARIQIFAAGARMVGT